MNERYGPAVHRIPTEIWWKILDEFIDSADPLFISTTFGGCDWSKYAVWHISSDQYNWKGQYDRRRKIVGCVCRSWRTFSQAKNNPHVILDFYSLYKKQLRDAKVVPKSRWTALRSNLCCSIGSVVSVSSHSTSCPSIISETDHRDEWLASINKSRAARRVTINEWSRIDDIVTSLKEGVDWEIIDIGLDQAAELARIPLPRLRRLRLWTHFNYHPLDLNPFLNLLDQFINLTWLEYEVEVARGDLVPIDIDRSPVILPNLQALWYKIRATFEFPFTQLILPSLQYLSLQIYELPSRIPLLELLSCYRQTLRSFTTTVFKWRGDSPIVHFPPWSDFPNLEELVLDQQWTAHFHHLPPNHPLRRLEACYDLV
jgi:hypothetical protein